MSVQRRRGQDALVWPQKEIIDRRGNGPMKAADMEAEPFQVRAAFIAVRGSRAEVAGQQEIDTYSMLVTHELPGVGLWSRVKWNGRYWDIVSPPEYRHGTRATRHWTLTIRARPPMPDG